MVIDESVRWVSPEEILTGEGAMKVRDVYAFACMCYTVSETFSCLASGALIEPAHGRCSLAISSSTSFGVARPSQ
jgi:hypothetical protein